ncbi:BatA domain-containing protein [Pontibacter aquaedesilientis]|uniref:BatA domain-containing protein n=1 Tax=Pontibacter aquaedesilientis TaxID=2766980 RepID=UPI001CD06879|nr:BatA domain-containing protein [Pontibacter aquaedesilientis]
MAFLYPTFLIALAAIAIPIVLHLIQLRKAKRVEFSNVKFIQVSKDLTASQRNLKDILILICRICFIIFLVLAFSQPFLPASESGAPTDSSQVTIALDNSLSMQNIHEQEDLSLLTVAVDQAKQVLDLFPATTPISINSNLNRNRAASVATGEARNTLDMLDYSTRSLIPFLTGSASGSTSSEHVFVFSDFQKSSFEPSSLNQLDSNRYYHLVPVKASSTSNVFVDSVYLTDEFIRPGGENQLHVKIYNASDKVIENCPVKLVIDEQQIAALNMDLPPNQLTEAAISFNFRGNSAKKAYILVEDYPVEFDNAYYFVLAPSGNLNILEIADNSSSPLQRLFLNEPFFRPTHYNTGNIDYSKMGESDLIILQGLNEIPSALVSTVAEYVKGGGSLVIIPSPSSQRAGYTALLQSLAIPASYTASSVNSSKTSLLVPERDNPFFRSIFSEYDSKMQMPAAVRSMLWSRASEDVLKFRGGAPFLSRFDRGQGQVFLMAASLDPAQNELVSHALFVPVMYRLAIGSYKQEQQIAYRLNGSTISIPVADRARREGVYKLVKDSVEFIPEQQLRGGKLIFTAPAEMGEAGFYELRRNDASVASFAFNYDKPESLLAQYSPSELKNFIRADMTNVHVYEYGDSFSVKGEFEKRFFGVKLWKYCLILCLIFLMAEIALIRFL